MREVIVLTFALDESHHISLQTPCNGYKQGHNITIICAPSLNYTLLQNKRARWFRRERF